MEHSAFPSDETLAAFIDGHLDEETRKRVVAHVADCEDCYGTVMASRAFQGEKEQSVTIAHPGSAKALWVSSGSVAAAAVIALVVFRVPLRERYEEYSYNRRTHIGTIIDAANRLPFRPSESRLSGQSFYQPAEPTKRGVKESSQPARLLAAAAEAEEATQSAPTAVRLHTVGASSLILGRIDAAVQQLDQALLQDHADGPLVAAIHASTDARLLNDAAAAHYARAKVRASAEDLLISHEAAARAWTLRKDASTAWNRALILQALELHDAAIAAWRNYLAIDSASRWSDEARDHLKELTTAAPSSSAFDGSKVRALAISGQQEGLIAIARSQPQDIRAFCEEDAFSAWARASLASDKVAAQEDLKVARALASAIQRAAQDDLDLETVLLIDKEQESPRGAALAQAIAGFADGRVLSRQHRTSDALAKLKSATAALRSLRCSLWLRSQVYIGTAAFYLGAYAESADAIRQIRDAVGDSADRYPSVIAQMEWIDGLLEGTANHPYEAVRAYRRAATHFETTGERDNAAFVQMLASEALTLTGDASEAWSSAIRALVTGRGYSTVRHMAIMNAIIGRAAFAAGYTASADEYAHAALSRELRNEDPPFVADALMLRGQTLDRMGAQARADLCWNAAAEIAQKIPDEALRNRMQADVVFARTTSGRARADDLDSSIDACRRKGDQFRLARLSFAKARRSAQAGGVVTAVSDYDAAINALSRVDATDVKAVRAWREGMRDSLDEAIGFAINNGRSEDALRWLTRVVGHSPVLRPPDDETAAVIYWALSDRVCSWVIRRSGIAFHVEPFSRSSLKRLVQAARQDQGSAADAYEKLLRPIERPLGRCTKLVILADEFFTSVPFSALYDRSRREYAVQRFDVRLARTIALLPSRDSSISWTPLVVADPAFDPGILPELPRLSGAAREAEMVRASFPRCEVLKGGHATLGAVERDIPHSSVLHVAAHAIGGFDSFAPSAIVLAAESDSSGLLYASNIRPETYGHLRLVVMSACRSAATGAGDVSDIAEAFLAAGVPNVIGSLSDIVDPQSAQFFVDFYRELRSANDPAVAFRRAQLADLRRHSAVWRNYVMFTGIWPKSV